jgi:hypothetical protein
LGWVSTRLEKTLSRIAKSKKIDKGCSNLTVVAFMRIEMALEFFRKFSKILLPSAPLTDKIPTREVQK